MFRPFPVFLGLRYTRAKRRNHFISFMSLSSMIGIAIGAMVLITVLSVMNGFEDQLRKRILGMTSHASVIGFTETFSEWESLRDELILHPEITAAAPFVEGQGMLRKGSAYSGVSIRGILPAEEQALSVVDENMQAGEFTDLTPGSYGIVLGVQLAAVLGVEPGDKVDLMIPQAAMTPAGILPRFRRFTVTGIFNVDMYEYDRSVAMVHMADLQKLYRYKDEVSGVRVEMQDMFDAPRLSQELSEQLDYRYIVHDWTKQHKNFFQAIATEKTVMFLILVLIIAVAAFNIVSALVMVVTDKQADIAVLRTLGATPRQIMTIFIVQGTVIGLVGTILGVIAGVLLAINVENIVPWIEQMIGRSVLGGDVYVITELKGDLKTDDVVRTAITAFGLSLLSTIYPAWRASRVQPAEALRYE